MGNTSGKPGISAQDRAILDMKSQRDKLHQYQKRITVITDRETAIARDCLSRNDKPKALLALRRKKFQESLLSKTDAQLATLEQLTANVEFALVQKDVMFGLKQGTQVLKQIQAEMGGIEHVEKLLGENEEARQYQQEVSDMLAGSMTRGDEEEVEEELELLERQVRNAELPSTLPPKYPIAPTGDLVKDKAEPAMPIKDQARKVEQRVLAS